MPRAWFLSRTKKANGYDARVVNATTSRRLVDDIPQEQKEIPMLSAAWHFKVDEINKFVRILSKSKIREIYRPSHNGSCDNPFSQKWEPRHPRGWRGS
jgi:hypothetical protein